MFDKITTLDELGRAYYAKLAKLNGKKISFRDLSTKRQTLNREFDARRSLILTYGS
jgi:hypothetical protein